MVRETGPPTAAPPGAFGAGSRDLITDHRMVSPGDESIFVTRPSNDGRRLRGVRRKMREKGGQRPFAAPGTSVRDAQIADLQIDPVPQG